MTSTSCSSKPKRLRVEVTQADIDNGVRNDCSRCALALALQKLPGGPGVRVGNATVSVVRGTGRTMYYLSKAARRFVERFDARIPVTPAVFVLRCPS